MSARVTRKRSRAEEKEQDLPPAKREPDQDDPESAGVPTGTGAWRAEQQAGDGQVFERDEEFWFEDGTVILVACDVEFRFYKGLLAGLSPVFKDLFEVRRLPCEQTFSCPVVHVSDSPEDLRHVLRTCSSKRPGRLYGEQEPSYQEISAAIRLGRKYKIADLYSQSMEYLKDYFTDTIECSGIPLSLSLPPGWKELDAIGVVNLARLTGELSLLPSAFIACICAKSKGPNGIVHGNTREDGSHEHLSSNDLAVCFNGKTSLRIATIAAVMRTFEPAAPPACERPTACKTALREVLLNLKDQLDLLLDGDPFVSYRMFSGPRGGLGVCRPCAAMVHERSLKERKDVWDRLPELLGIDVPGWRQEPAPLRPQPEGGAT
ncbi:hypothetical protein LXA43DRAFT_1108611 [Ganoderma leucocontextum]|nr:hypothetical protein LXA43DRAFT_1108611 [Ganoderma leucocontextum]